MRAAGLMPMFVVAVVAVLAGLALARRDDHPPPPMPDFDDVQDLLMGLEDDKYGLYDGISDIRTICQLFAMRIHELVDEVHPVLSDRVEGQISEIDTLSKQVKDMTHRVRQASAKILETTSLASTTGLVVVEQLNDYLNGSRIAGAQEVQGSQIAALQAQLDSTRTGELSEISNLISSLNTGSLTPYAEEVENAATTQDSRHCEYGTGHFTPGFHNVTFNTDFEGPPTVTIMMTGFSSHLDDRYYNENGFHRLDTLDVNKLVNDVTTEYFQVHLSDESTGSVEFKTVSCSWTACFNLDVGEDE